MYLKAFIASFKTVLYAHISGIKGSPLGCFKQTGQRWFLAHNFTGSVPTCQATNHSPRASLRVHTLNGNFSLRHICLLITASDSSLKASLIHTGSYKRKWAHWITGILENKDVFPGCLIRKLWSQIVNVSRSGSWSALHGEMSHPPPPPNTRSGLFTIDMTIRPEHFRLASSFELSANLLSFMFYVIISKENLYLTNTMKRTPSGRLTAWSYSQ